MSKFNKLYEAKISTGPMYYFTKPEKNDKPVAIYGSHRLDLVWYKAIHELGGMPVDTEGKKIDSLAKITSMVKSSPNKIAPMTMDTSNYRTNKDWFSIIHSSQNIKKDKNYEQLG